MNNYNHKNIEKKWQDKWQSDGIYNVSDKAEGKDKFYQLVEFSYPSGNLHVGHWYAFSVPDIFARYKRMQGFNVLYPMGFDAFGLPAENAAIKLGADPKVWTYEQMEKMRTQLRTMGASFPWDREVVTCDPEYYKWTQWMFNQFLKNDLVYRAITKVNWCSKDQTILANEQVTDGKCERCGTEVVQRDQPQWMLRITKYADRLIDDLDNLDWPNAIKESQKNWIGRSEGSEIEFKLKADSAELEASVNVFTTRADTLFGVTYVVLAPEHAILSNLKSKIENWDEVETYIETTKKKSELERQIGSKDPSTGSGQGKTGVEVKGIKAINPANGEEVSVWIADYVLAGYGTGAVMAVPAHDERDFEFAKKYNLPMTKVNNGLALKIFGNTKENARIIELVDENYIKKQKLGSYSANRKNDQEWLHTFVFSDKEVEIDFLNLIKRMEFSFQEVPFVNESSDVRLINSDKFNGLIPQEAKQKITEFVGGKIVKTYRLRDWGISRQRYWGCPIPIVYDPEGNAHPVPDEHLPWILPTDVDHTPDGTAPLARSKELFERTEKIFGAGWRPEVETMDTFVDSSWYFYRYLDNKNDKEFSAMDKMDAWMPIDLYMGGAEHTTMHLLYSRFWAKALYDLGFVKDNEAYKVRRNRGLILGPDGEKMSKSRGNVINPDEIVERLGADTVRLYLAFMGPYGNTANYPWDPNGVVGVRRFIERVWRLKEKIDQDKKVCRTDSLVHKTIKGVKEDIEEFKFNTAISKMMILLNALEKEEKVVFGSYKILLKLLAPFAPHITEELWQEIGENGSIHLAKWPKYDESLIMEEEKNLAVSFNGKGRGVISVPAGLDQFAILDKVFELEQFVKYRPSSREEIKNVIFVKDRIINIIF